MAKFWCRDSEDGDGEWSWVDEFDPEMAACVFVDKCNNDSGGEDADSMLRYNQPKVIDVYADGKPDAVYRVTVYAEAEVNFYSMRGAELVSA